MRTVEDGLRGRVVVCSSSVLGLRLQPFAGAEYTSARRVEAHAGRSVASRSLGAVMNGNLPNFGVRICKGVSRSTTLIGPWQ